MRAVLVTQKEEKLAMHTELECGKVLIIAPSFPLLMIVSLT